MQAFTFGYLYRISEYVQNLVPQIDAKIFFVTDIDFATLVWQSLFLLYVAIHSACYMVGV